ncbi:L,D-transpeptidase [Ramlibacter ginsenosidimutans]|uniref:L,D-transpeptidase n=1 Tax=Ramlibacter ginsenosidimutans TaxID=502333 RepID=UPI00191DE62F|nr:L,D-transpeptidase [Ramlibacter ginsenosidimutans]
MPALARPPVATPLLLALALVTAPCFASEPHEAHASKPHATKPHATKPHASKSAATKGAHGPLADMGKVRASKDVVQVANWVSYTYDSHRRPFVIVDKKAAQMYVFDGWGRLWNTSPVLIGKAVGDDSAPGVGSKRLSQLKPSEKTTPAGRFEARPGKDNYGKDVVWIDYDAALSMHAIASVSPSERRAERMAMPDPREHRISNGCINLPPRFFSGVLWPTVQKHGAIVYVLPETRTPAQQFGAYDVSGERSPV